MIKFFIFKITFLLFLSNCSHIGFEFPGFKRQIASIERSSDLVELIESLEQAVDVGAENSLACSNGLNDYYQALYRLKSSQVKTDELTKEDIDEVIRSSFFTRIAIGEKLGALNISDKVDQDCLDRVKDVIRALRYVEDYMIELRLAHKKIEDNYVTLKGEAPYFLVNPKYEGSFNSSKDLQSGDVILSRGNAYSSAAIARIGTNDTQFSHLSFVYRDEKGELHTTEAHIEVGNVVAPIKTHIDQGNARTVVFRYKDPEMAHKASKLIYERVKKGVPGFFRNPNIKYDFGMDYRDNELLFCSEVVYAGFMMASEDKIEIPKHKTKFNPGLLPFLKTLGIAVTEENIADFDTFGPGDIQFDARFDLIAEWRNPQKLEDNRIKDLILTKMFQWMEEENYMLDSSFGINFKSGLLYGLRRTPLISLFIKNKFPKNMTKAQLKMFLVLDVVGEIFHKVISDHQKKIKKPLTPIEVFGVLNQFKREDAARYERYKFLESELKKKKKNRIGKMSKKEIKQQMKQTTPHFHNWFYPMK